MPAGLPFPDPARGGVARVVPPGGTDRDGTVGIISTGDSAPVSLSVSVPAPPPGQDPVAVLVQPLETRTTTITWAPAARSVTSVLIEVFDPVTGHVYHYHSRPLHLEIRLTEEQRAQCLLEGRTVALVHTDSFGRGNRIAARVDCAAGVVRSSVDSTSIFSVATLDLPVAIPYRLLVAPPPDSPRPAARRP